MNSFEDIFEHFFRNAFVIFLIFAHAFEDMSGSIHICGGKSEGTLYLGVVVSGFVERMGSGSGMLSLSEEQHDFVLPNLFENVTLFDILSTAISCACICHFAEINNDPAVTGMRNRSSSNHRPTNPPSFIRAFGGVVDELSLRSCE